VSAPKRGAIQRFGRKIRFRIFWIIVAFGVGASSTWYFREDIFRWLLAPAKGALSPWGLPVFTGPTEMLGSTISLAIKGGLVVAFPVLVFSIYGLAKPLLGQKQRRFAIVFLPAILLCYLGGAAFAYFVMLPTGMKFLLHFGTNIAVPVIRISEYMAIVTAMLFWLGIVFEIPLVMFLLAKMRLVSRRRFKRFRKYVPFAAFFLGAIITPTFDALNQTLVAVPIIVLYEFGLILSWVAEGGTRRVGRRVKAVVLGIVRRPCGWIKWTGRRLMFWRR
jgi:sec-independent protein translocase protein TatC